jgi:nucleoside-diphosphate-sugar epimerase
MDPWPETIRDERELDEVLSRPQPAIVDFVRRLDGDVLVLGAGGKIGPTLVRMLKRAVDAAGAAVGVIAVARGPLEALASGGIRTLACDLMDPTAVARLPRTANVFFLAGRKFGTSSQEHLTWATNVLVPYHVARTFLDARIVAFSTGCVYPLMDASTGGATEATPPDPIGEYSMSCLGRERVFDYFSHTAGEKVLHLRLNYAVELRYGVLVDIAAKVWRGEPVDLAAGHTNVIWQGDVCHQAILGLGLAASPPAVLNVTGPEMLPVRETAETFGQLLGRPVRFTGVEGGRTYLSNAARARALFGPPAVPVDQVIRWTADWVRRGGRSLGKPTHFEVSDGKF